VSLWEQLGQGLYIREGRARGKARTLKAQQFFTGVPDMKPLWTQTLAWIVAIVIAVLFAVAGSDNVAAPGLLDLLSHGSETPR
jgi:hypothetical protein